MLDWLTHFLARNDLEKPDGRTLFRYRATDEEYRGLLDVLSHADPLALKKSLVLDRLFVLFASEWWRRNYSGGAWSWRSITEPLNWPALSHKQLSTIVASGLRYWQRPLLTYQDMSNAFLLSIVLEGGLPVNILETAGNSLTRYLRALLDDFSTYRGSGIATEKLAEDIAHYLPQGFRRQGVYQLAAQLTEVIFELADLLDSRDDPFGQLEKKKPGWQEDLPFVLESDNARHLVNGLLRQAKTRQSGLGQQFRVRRRFTLRGDSWVPTALLVLPSEVAVAQIARQVGQSETTLGARLELTLETTGDLRKVGMLVRTGEAYRVFVYDRNRLEANVWPVEPVSCSLTAAGQYLGRIEIDGGEPASERLPLVLAAVEGKDDELEIVGVGGLRTRRPEVFVLIPDGIDEFAVEGEWADVAGQIDSGSFKKLRGSLRIDLADGIACIIRTGQEGESETHARFRGTQIHALESATSKVFAGFPQIMVRTATGLHKQVQNRDIRWRYWRGERDWHPYSGSVPHGQVEIRVLQEGSCILAETLSVLPEDFSFRLIGGSSPSEGTIEIANIGDAAIGSTDSRVQVSAIKRTGGAVTIPVCSEEVSQERVPLTIRWSGGGECSLIFPYPAAGAAFITSDMLKAVDGEIPLGAIIHVTALGISIAPGESFFLTGSVRAEDVTAAVARSLSFNVPLNTQGSGFHELPLQRLFNDINELFSYSADLDARVTLEIVNQGRSISRLDIVQFEGELAYSADTGCIGYRPVSSVDVLGRNARFSDVELIPFLDDDSGLKAVPASQAAEPDCGWVVTAENGQFGPAIAAPLGAIRSVRPCVVFSTAEQAEEGVAQSAFERAWLESDKHERLNLLEQSVAALEMSDTEWPVLERHLKGMGKLHPDCLDTLQTLIEHPSVMAEAFLRLGSQYISMFEDWQSYLPFRWWQVPIQAWITALDRYSASLRAAGAEEEMVQFALEQKWADLQTLYQRVPQLMLIKGHIGKEYFGKAPSKLMALVEASGPKVVFNHLSKELAMALFRAKAEATWPQGPDRSWWAQRVQEEGGADTIPWLDDAGMKYRGPFLDAVVAQALAIANGRYLDREARVIVASIRSFAPDHFDQMYPLALAVFYHLR